MEWKSTTGVRVSSAGVTLHPDSGNSPEIEDLTIPQLVSYLRASRQTADFTRVEQILQSRQELLKADIEREFSEDIAVREVELQVRCTALDRALTEEKDRNDAMAAELTVLERERSLARAKAEKYTISCGRLVAQIAGLKGDCGAVREQVQRALENISQYLETQKDQILGVEQKKQEEERRIQSEMEHWKRKCADLEAQVRRLEEERRNLKSSDTGRLLDGEGRRSILRAQLKLDVGSRTPIGTIDISDSDDDIHAVVDAPKSSTAVEMDQKNVGAEESDEEDGICSKNFPSTKTPKRKSVSRVVTSDSENDETEDWVPLSKLNQKKLEDVIEEDDGSTRTPKRKCTSRVVTSDSEDDEDNDCIPLSKLKQRRLVDVTEEDGGPIKLSDRRFSSYGGIQENVTSPLRRLVSLRERDETRNVSRGTSPRDSTPQTYSPTETGSRVLRTRANARRKIEFSDVKSVVEDEVRRGKKADDDDDASESESEGESLGGFIVNVTDSESGSDDAYEEEGEGEDAGQSDSDVELDDVLAKLCRGKGSKNWEYEADMLSAFGKCPELCMKAVCALYRLQTSEEQSVKQSFVANRQGFSKFDAIRGSMLAEFLTNGNADGPVTKTVQQLKEHDRKGLEDCYELATRYSKQLFGIYQNKSDPNFGPS